MEVYRKDSRFHIEGQGICGSWPDVGVNRKVAVAFLRSLHRVEDGKALFTLEALSGIVGSKHRQAASEHTEQFRACGEDFGAFLKRRRKVDEAVVAAVLEAVRTDPVADVEVLRERVQERLGREDLTGANISAALDQISYRQMRGVLKQQLERGQDGLQYKEATLLADMMEKVDSEEVKAGLEVDRQQVDRPLVDPSGIRTLLEPGAGVEEVSDALQWICRCITLFHWGIPLSRLGLWLGVDKSTILRWMVGLVNEIFGTIQDKVVSGIRLGVVYVDEKWIKIRGVWHYWFVVLDEKTELPLICYLAKTRSRHVCQWIGLWLKKFPGQVKAVVTDGLKSYRYLLPDVLHLLCHFHHQRGVLTWLKEHLPGSEKQDQPKAKMKQVLQTTDKRTVKRRLDKLEQQAQTWGIQGWIDNIRESLGELLPPIGSRMLPRTTNAIERFFCAFNRFYKVRRGFHSLESARDQLCLFLVGYLFSKRAKDGTAPIETIWPEAAQTPLYRLLNDPFGLRRDLQNVKEMPKMADESVAHLLQA